MKEKAKKILMTLSYATIILGSISAIAIILSFIGIVSLKLVRFLFVVWILLWINQVAFSISSQETVQAVKEIVETMEED